MQAATMTNSPDTDKRVCLGVIAGAHGVRGQVRVKSFAAKPKDVTAYGPLSDESGARLFDLSLTGSAKGVLLARIVGVTDRDAAEALRGVELWVERSKLPAPDDDEFYHADLIGLPAFHPDGRPYGTVLALHDFGAGEMIEFDLEAGGSSVGDTVILPFTHAVVPEIESDRVVVVAPVTVDAKASGESETVSDPSGAAE
jgi:16S rRNA processing protein RimM